MKRVHAHHALEHAHTHIHIEHKLQASSCWIPNGNHSTWFRWYFWFEQIERVNFSCNRDDYSSTTQLYLYSYQRRQIIYWVSAQRPRPIASRSLCVCALACCRQNIGISLTLKLMFVYPLNNCLFSFDDIWKVCARRSSMISSTDSLVCACMFAKSS